MFPTTDSSQTVIDALHTAAENAKVQIKTRTKVEAILPDYDNNSFQVTYTVKMEDDTKKTSTARFDAVILATGSAPAGYVLVRDHLAHPFVDTVPSLFTLNCKHAVKEGNLLYGLSGVSVAKGRVSFKLPSEGADAEATSKRKKTKWIEQEGPLLITHHGLSGPAALRLSAFGAREFATANYRGDLKIHWAPDLGRTDDVFDQLCRSQLFFGRRGFEGVQIHHHQVDRHNSMSSNRFAVIRSLAAIKKAAMDLGVQRLHATPQHLRPAGQLGNVAHRHSGVTQELRGAARGNDFNTQRHERARELRNTRFVVNTDQRPFDGQACLRATFSRALILRGQSGIEKQRLG